MELSIGRQKVVGDQRKDGAGLGDVAKCSRLLREPLERLVQQPPHGSKCGWRPDAGLFDRVETARSNLQETWHRSPQWNNSDNPGSPAGFAVNRR